MVAIFCKWPQLFHQSIVTLHENARHHTPNWTAVYGCKSDRLWISPNLIFSVLSLTESFRSKWLQQMLMWSKLQKLDNSVFILEYKLWYHFGANAIMVVVTTLKSDVYHLLCMCHVLNKVTITSWHESVCYIIFLKFFLCTLQSDQVS
jgi:hypothetical protein